MKIKFDDNGRQCGYMELKGSTEKTKAQLYIYGDICGSNWEKCDSDDKCPQDVANLLNSIDTNADIDIYINSGGGDAFGALAIVSQLQRHSGKKTAYVDGLAASAASYIAISCDQVIMNSSAQIMIHKPLVYASYSNADRLRDLANELDRLQESIIDIYMTNIKDGVTRDDIVQKVNAETWLKGSEAAKIFNITLKDFGQAVACSSGYFDRYKNVPDEIKANSAKDKTTEKRKKALQIQLDLLRLQN